MTGIGIGIDTAALDRARMRFEALGRIGIALAELSRPIGYLHDRGGAVLKSDEGFADERRFTKFVARALPGIDPDDLALLWAEFAISGADRPAMQVIVQRALDPLSGLDTYPADVMFTPDELLQLETIDREAVFDEPKRRGAVTGIVKVTRHCNLRCTYCHDWRVGRDAAMSFEVLGRTMRWLVGESGARKVNVVLHGGEPSLIGVDGLIRLLALQARYRRPETSVATRMQTNGARLSDALIAVLVQFGIVSSVSLDGPPEVHDRTRLTVGGTGSSDAARRGIARLRQAGVLNGVLIVVTPTLVEIGAQRLVEWLCEEGISAIALLAMRPPAGPTPSVADSLPTEIYCDFLVEVDRCRKAIHPSLAVREIEAVEAALVHGEPQTCELQGFCVGHYVAIEPDGSVSHCDKFLGDPDYVLGTVEQPFAEVVTSSAAQRLTAIATAAAQAKRDCKWWVHCRGWCPHEDYVARRLGQPDACCGLAPLFEGLAHDATPGLAASNPVIPEIAYASPGA